ncbi:hypothetical protein HJC23_002694 [Cyclotella cryptica]|uniref:Uncharacterized protein n=1 Tax=Cyclotella cryptica TaxID=29204 RepID=A0ABD3NJ27_9STRA|eukprot:CCRYP_021019-RA/>CCRYP_021019-RA protein AED:0.20 eAED:0.20 QI:0/-1/0/1/-1/1/1/0/312
MPLDFEYRPRLGLLLALTAVFLVAVDRNRDLHMVTWIRNADQRHGRQLFLTTYADPKSVESRQPGPFGLVDLYITDDFNVISRENKVVYIHVPKTGGSTFERSTLFADANAHHPVGGHLPVEDVMRNAEERGIDGFLTVAHIRHPCSRFISAFEYMKSDKGALGDQSWARKNIGSLSIDEFVLKVQNDPSILSKVHFRPMVSFLFYRDGSFGIDQVICQERWNAGLRRLASKMKTPLPDKLFSTHVNENPHNACKDLKVETRLVIEQVYRMDYCVFGYDHFPHKKESCPQSRTAKEHFTQRYAQCLSSSRVQ